MSLYVVFIIFGSLSFCCKILIGAVYISKIVNDKVEQQTVGFHNKTGSGEKSNKSESRALKKIFYY